jgi:hypothetical protein
MSSRDHHKEHGAQATFSPRGVLEVLQERGANWVTFWYVPVAGEPCLPGPNVLFPVPRERSQSCVTPVEGIRANFFFVMVDANTMWMCELSYHCDICQTGDFKACPHDDECGTWKVVKLLKTVASCPVTLRSAKSNLDAKRRALARAAAKGDLLAGMCGRSMAFRPGPAQ